MAFLCGTTFASSSLALLWPWPLSCSAGHFGTGDSCRQSPKPSDSHAPLQTPHAADRLGAGAAGLRPLCVEAEPSFRCVPSRVLACDDCLLAATLSKGRIAHVPIHDP